MDNTILGTALIIGGIATNQVEGVLIKRYSLKHSSGGFILTAFISFFSMLFFLVTGIGDLYFTLPAIGYGLVAGTLYATASVLTFFAIGCGPFALSQLILSYGLIFKILYGILFLKESAGVFTYIGIAVIVVSIFLTRAEKAPEQHKASAKWALFITIALLSSGLLGVVQKMYQQTSRNMATNSFMVVALGFSSLSLFVIGMIRDGKQLTRIVRNGFFYAFGAGVSNGVTNMTILVVNTLVPLSFSAPLRAGLKIVIVYLLSRFLFHEHFLARQKVGVVLGALALVLLNIK